MLSQQPLSTTSSSTSVIEEKLETKSINITLKILNENFETGRFKGCLVLDFDETLLHYDHSLVLEKLVLKREEEFREILKEAKENNILVVIGTARTATIEASSKVKPYLTVEYALKAMGIENFSAIYFSNGNFKSHILLHLKDKFFKDDPKGFDKIAFVDDLEHYLTECRMAGFKNSFSSDNILLQFDLRDFFAIVNGREPEPLIAKEEKSVGTSFDEIAEDEESDEELQLKSIDQFEPDADSDYYTFFKKFSESKNEDSKKDSPEFLRQKRQLSENMGELLKNLNQDDAEILAEEGLLNNLTVQLMLDEIDMENFLSCVLEGDLVAMKHSILPLLTEGLYLQLFTTLTHLQSMGIKDEATLKRTFNVASGDDNENLQLLSYLLRDYPKNLLDQGRNQYDAILEILEILTPLHLNTKENMTKLKQMTNLDYALICAELKDLQKLRILDQTVFDGALEPVKAKSTNSLK